MKFQFEMPLVVICFTGERGRTFSKLIGIKCLKREKNIAYNSCY